MRKIIWFFKSYGLEIVLTIAFGAVIGGIVVPLFIAMARAFWQFALA